MTRTPKRTSAGARGASPARVSVKVVPRASKDEVIGWMGDALKVRIAAVPEQGKANAALEALLASVLGVSRRDVKVVAGHGSPRKVVEIAGLEAQEIERRLPRHL